MASVVYVSLNIFPNSSAEFIWLGIWANPTTQWDIFEHKIKAFYKGMLNKILNIT